MKKCNKCGMEVKDGQNYCPECGNNMVLSNTKIKSRISMVIIIVSTLIVCAIGLIIIVLLIPDEWLDKNSNTSTVTTTYNNSEESNKNITTTTELTTTVPTTTVHIETEAEFKSSCKKYTYKELARKPKDYMGTRIKLTGEVVQTMYSTDGSVSLRVDITKKGTYSIYYTDTVFVTYQPAEDEPKILEDDIIDFWGIGMGEYTYESVLGSQVTLPWIKAKYITIK